MITQKCQESRPDPQRGEGDLYIGRYLMATVSELLFESCCESLGLDFERIEPSSDRRPDYMIFPEGQKVVVEVKQIDMNPEEEAEYKKFCEGGIAQGGGTAGYRARMKISDANQQLATLTGDSLPGILVLFDNTPLGWHTVPYNLKTSMFGLEVVVFEKPEKAMERARFHGPRFGPKRKMTPASNTSTSAVAVLFRGVEEGAPPYMVLYHNIFAKTPLEQGIARLFTAKQLIMNKGDDGTLRDWVEIE